MLRKRLLTLMLAALSTPAVPTAALHAQGFLSGNNHVRLGVVLPLKEKSPRGAKMVEFYQGLLMAVDSMKHSGLNVDVIALHSGTTASDMDSLVNTHSLAACNVVFGPLDAQQLPTLADYCNIHGVRLVYPFAPTMAYVKGHPHFYAASAPRHIVQQEAAWFVKEKFGDHNIILVECNEGNEEGAAFGEQLRTTMSERGVYIRPLNVNGDEMAYYQAFNPLRKNLLVLNSSSQKALNTFLPKLKNYRRNHPELEVSVLGYPSWQTYTAQSLNDFYDNDTYIYTSFYRHPLTPRNEIFDRQFVQWFHRPMQATFPRYGQMGFDLGYFFLRGLSIYGDNFENNLDNVPAKAYQNPLWFERQGMLDGFVNTFVELVHYTPYQTIELMTRTR